MAALKGSKTEDNLKAAFAGESQANRRYLYFANKPMWKVNLTWLRCSAPRQKRNRPRARSPGVAGNLWRPRHRPAVWRTRDNLKSP